jgi:hypothetical protein
MAEIEQGVNFRVHFQDYIPAPATVPPVRAAARLVFFPVEMDHAISPATGLYKDLCFVKKHRNISLFTFSYQWMVKPVVNLTALKTNRGRR